MYPRGADRTYRWNQSIEQPRYDWTNITNINTSDPYRVTKPPISTSNFSIAFINHKANKYWQSIVSVRAVVSLLGSQCHQVASKVYGGTFH